MYRTGLAIAFIALLAVMGCTSASESPLTPSRLDSSFTAPPAGRYLWGVFDVAFDPSSDNPVTITPLRSGAFHANIRKFLEESPCNHCLSIGNAQLTPGGFRVDVSITNPFSYFSGLYGFDVRGIFFFDGNIGFPKLGVNASSPVNGGAHVVNADGYATIFNPTEYPGNTCFSYSKGRFVPPSMPDPTATLGSFKAFYSEGQSEEYGGRRAFYPGDTVMRRYEVATPVSGPFHYGYAIDCSWHSPTKMPPDGVQDFPPAANCLEPFRIDVLQSGNTLTPLDGSVTLQVLAYDHQGADGIVECRAEAPGLTDSLVYDKTPEIVDPKVARFELIIPNTTGAADLAGEEVLIQVVHKDSDPNLGKIPAWAFAVLNVGEKPPSPVVLWIVPHDGYQNAIVSATITGTGFLPNPDVQLYQELAVIHGSDVNVVDSTTITASFDLTAPLGFYTLYVQNEDGQWGELKDAFEIILP